jgi:hypothetical protein
MFGRERFCLGELGGAAGAEAAPHFGQADQVGLVRADRGVDQRAQGGDVVHLAGAGFELDDGCAHSRR